MKRLIFLALFIASGATAQTPPAPTVTPLSDMVPRSISLIEFRADDQYGPNIPAGQRDYSFTFVVSDQNGNELRRQTAVLDITTVPLTEARKLNDFLIYLRSTVEKRVLPASSLTPFPQLSPTPTEPPLPTPAPSPSP